MSELSKRAGGFMERRVLPHGWEPRAVGDVFDSDGRRYRVTRHMGVRWPGPDDFRGADLGFGARIETYECEEVIEQ